MSRKSAQPGFKVAETVGKAAEGEHSILSLNNRIIAATSASEVFEPMWQLCLVCATQRKIISKVRGDSNDFFNYATLGYVERWKKQFDAPDKRRPMQMIQNWIPYILGTIRFALMSFNKDAQDFDFLPMPKLYVDKEDDEGTSRDLEAKGGRDPILALALEEFTDATAINEFIFTLPTELRPYLVDILYYIRTQGQVLSKKNFNYVKIGRNIFLQKLEERMC